MHFDEHIHVPAPRRLLELQRLRVRHARHDDEDAIRAPGARLGHLVGIVHEILAQHRQVAGGARLSQVVRRALETRAVGQHRQAGGTARRIGLRQRGGVEIFADQALRGARLLDLGDEAVPGLAGLQERPGKGAHGRRVAGLGLDLLDRLRRLRRGDLLELVVPDPVQDGRCGHWASDVALASAARRVRAAPESMLSAAMATPSRRSSVRPATVSAAAALSSTASRYAPGAPSRRAPSARPFSSGVPPRMASNGCTGRPKSSGCSSASRMRPSSSSAASQVTPVMVISSVPSLPCTSQARSLPNCPSVSAIGRMRSRENAPVSCRFTPAGLVSGPRMLKIVRVPSSARTGPTWAIAGWCIGAIMKAMPTSRSTASTASAPIITFTPSCPSASAAPDFELRLRLPCLATGTPAPATTSAAAAEMLSVPLPSPPVPTMSMAPAGARTL